MKNSKKTSVVVATLSVLTLMMGVIDIISAITPTLPERAIILRMIFPFVIRSTVRLGTALIGLFLIFLSGGLRRRKQTAWVISVVVLFTSFVFHLIKGLDIEEAVITTGLLVALVYEKNNFMAKPDMPSLVQGLKALAFAFIFTFFYGTIGLYIMGRNDINLFNIPHSFLIVFNSFFLISPAPVFTNHLIGIFFDSIYLIGFVSIIFAIYMIFRPVILRFETSEEDRERAEGLLRKFGRNYSAGVILLPGKYYFFNSNGKGFIAYKPVGGYAVVLADPVCSLSNVYKNAKEFANYCHLQGWLPIFAGVSKEFVGIAERLKFKSFSVGNVPMIDLQNYSLEGGEKKPLRYSINVMERLGYTFKVENPPINDRELTKFKQTSDYWLRHFKGKEMKFLVGYFDKKYIKNNMVAGVFTSKDENIAFVNFYEYGDREIAIDLMRHKNVPPDTMLYLFTNIILWAKEKGYKKLNLGMAPLYGLGGKGSKVEEKALRIIFNRFNKIYNFKGLYIFKSKFQPDWEPLYLVYPSKINLTGATTALLLAN